MAESVLRSLEDVLELPEGVVAEGVIGARVEFSDAEILDAARVLIEHGDVFAVTSKAVVIARAANLYGWGDGRRLRIIDKTQTES